VEIEEYIDDSSLLQKKIKMMLDDMQNFVKERKELDKVIILFSALLYYLER